MKKNLRYLVMKDGWFQAAMFYLVAMATVNLTVAYFTGVLGDIAAWFI